MIVLCEQKRMTLAELGMSRLVQILRTKAHRQQILQRHHLDVRLVELLTTFIRHRLLNRLCRSILAPLAPHHQDSGLETAQLPDDLSADTAGTAAAL